MATLKENIKAKLWQKFHETSGYEISENGYVSRFEHNLVPGVKTRDFERDLRQGSGNELEEHFLAVHSSSALAVNTFAIWKDKPQDLVLLGLKGFKRIYFEKKCPTGLGRTPPNLDILAESETTIVGIESKLLEPLSKKRPKFSSSYNQATLHYIEEEWGRLLEDKRKGKSQYLDVAQLVKHYLGLRNQYHDRAVFLLYLFWEPINWQESDVFVRHREEISAFSEQVKGSLVTFVAQSYLDLWIEWENYPILTRHLTNLRKRYLIEI